MAKYDEMSFGKAFAAARKEMGAGKTFTWKGKKYTTDLKEEAGKTSGATSPRPKARPKSPMEGYRTGDVTTSKITPAGGRGDGGAERIRRVADAAISRATQKPLPKATSEVKPVSRPPKKLSPQEMVKLTPKERAARNVAAMEYRRTLRRNEK